MYINFIGYIYIYIYIYIHTVKLMFNVGQTTINV